MPDLTSMAISLGALLKSKQQTLAVSESAGGGLISASLVAVPGASAYYVGGVVVYTPGCPAGIAPGPRPSDGRNSGQQRALRHVERPHR